jgi:hypothetical protein
MCSIPVIGTAVSINTSNVDVWCNFKMWRLEKCLFCSETLKAWCSVILSVRTCVCWGGTHITWKGQLGVCRNFSSRMLRWGTVLTVERHQHLSTRLIGLAEEGVEQRTWMYSVIYSNMNIISFNYTFCHGE